MHGVTVKNAVDGFFIESSLKMITLKTREKAVDGIGSFILVVLILRFQYQGISYSLSKCL
jgi:hypothetical protein